MTQKPRIAVIIGSTRDTQFADKPAAWIFDLAKQRADWDVELVDLRDFDLPFFNEKASNLWVPSEDPKAVAWQEKLATFDGFIFVTAEYNRSITGALKNALDQAYKQWITSPPRSSPTARPAAAAPPSICAASLSNSRWFRCARAFTSWGRT